MKTCESSFQTDGATPVPAIREMSSQIGTDGNVLVVDDHHQARESMADVLRQSGHTVRCCSSAREALKVLDKETFDCIVTDLKMPGMDGLEFIIQVERRPAGPQIVMVTAHATVTSAVEAMRHGAFDYIEKPFDVDRLEQLVSRAIQHGRLVQGTSTGSDRDSSTPPMMIGESSAMQKLRERIAAIARTDETVLIMGESGTGKELVAQTIHAVGLRGSGPMVSVNCPALTAQLLESELFGHQRGAFTGAESDRTGRFEMADSGSILLDEVTEIDLNLQAKLLRVLQERSFERVGSSQTISVDTRVIATTNRDLAAEVEEGRFRHDLYYRLAVLPIHVPALRDRVEDIPELCDYFLARCAGRLQRLPCELDESARQLLGEYHWPGNVRELENIITRASVLGDGQAISADMLRRWLIVDGSESNDSTDIGSNESHDVTESDMPVGVSLQEMEKRLIEATLEHYDGLRAKTAAALGIGVRTLSSKLRQYGYAPREKTASRGKSANP